MVSTCTYTTSYRTVQSVIDDAALVVVGTPVAEAVQVRGWMPFTVATVKLEKVLKGTAAPENLVKVLQTGGRVGQIEFPFPEEPLRLGESHLLFLLPGDDGLFLVAGGYQGQALVHAGRLVVPRNKDRLGVELRGLSLEAVAALAAREATSIDQGNGGPAE